MNRRITSGKIQLKPKNNKKRILLLRETMKEEVSVELGTFNRTYSDPSSRWEHEESDDEEEALLLRGAAGNLTETDLRSIEFKENEWKDLLDRLIRDADSDECFLRKLKSRIDR